MKRNITIVAATAILILVILSVYYYGIQSRQVVQNNSPFITEYSTSSTSSPNAIAVDMRGNVWFTLENKSALVELNPLTKSMQLFPFPRAVGKSSVTWGIAIDNNQDLVWLTEQVSNAIWSFNMTSHAFKEYPLKTPNAFPFDITIDQENDVWFTELFSNKIGEIANGSTLVEFPIPVNGDAEPSGITVAPSNVIWVTLPGVESIGSFARSKFNIYNLTGLITSPVGISVDNQGNLWMTQHGPSFISEFNPVNHYFRTISTSIPALHTSLPYFVQVDSKGDVWFNEHYGNVMGLFEPTNNTMIEYQIPTRISWAGNISGMLTMALSPDGAPWFTEFFSGKVGTVNDSIPLDLELRLLNYSTVSEMPVQLVDGRQISLQLSLNESSSSTVLLQGSVGNFTTGFAFTFQPSSGSGTFDSVVTIRDNGAKSGVYYLTISAETNDLVISKIVLVQVS